MPAYERNDMTTLKMGDPTRVEIDEALAAMPSASEFDEFDREAAIYWFAAEWHAGQWSNLYSVLSCSAYRPGCLEREARDGARIVQDYLEDRFST